MRNIFPILVCFSILSLSSCADKRPELDTIRSKKTSDHLNIGGTRLFIIPPKGFTISDEFVGLIKDRNCSIQMLESKGQKIRGPFSAYNEAAFTKQGKKILESKKIRVNEYSGKLIVIPGRSENSEILYLLFGDNSFSVLITASYETVEKKTREEIYNSLKTIYVDQNFKSTISIYSSYFFSSKNYKYCQKIIEFDLYTANGELNRQDIEEPVVLVTTIKHVKNVGLDKLAEMNRLGMEQQGATLSKITELSNAPINRYEALSRKISFSTEGTSKTTYQAFVKKGDQVILIQGIVFDKDLDKLEGIKQFTNSIVIR
jgi:hypothetical protein